jgi:hypothetical protein
MIVNKIMVFCDVMSNVVWQGSTNVRRNLVYPSSRQTNEPGKEK